MKSISRLILSRHARASSWHSSVKAGRRWYELFLSMIHIIVGRVSKGYVASVLLFVRHCIMIRRKQGIPGLCRRLKASNVLLMQALAGKPHHSSQELGVAIARTRSGYPRSIPIHHRRRLEKGDLIIVRLYLSLYSLYRVLDWKGKLSLKTIVKPSTVPWSSSLFEEFRSFLPVFFAELKRTCDVDWDSFAKDDMKKFKESFRLKYLPITKSGPDSSGSATSMWALPYQINAWFHPDNARLYSALEGWCILLDIKHVFVFMNMFNRVYDMYLNVMKIATPWQRCLAKLSIKEEPGKVRVFAMVDYITQVIMSPLHEFLFKILKSIPQDGTFNQSRPLERLVKSLEQLHDRLNPPVRGSSKRKFAGYDLSARKSKLGKIWRYAKVGRCYSFDLSAATDRLPVLYQALIVQQLHPKLGVTWKELLVGRDYYVSQSMKKLVPDLPVTVRYTVGQPMGALSSWAMLAITHHAIVQWAAHRAGQRGWYEYYAVLGDDVVIANDKVAFQYLRIMRALGVEISLAKTLLGTDRSMEFAKRFFLNGKDASPLSTLEFLAGLGNLSALVTLVAKARRLVDIRLADVAKACKWGYRVCGSLDGNLSKLGSRAQGLVLLFTRPGSPFGVDTVLNWLFLERIGSVREVPEEQKARVVESLESTLFRSYEEQVENMVKKTLQPPKFKHPKTGRWVEDPNRARATEHYLFGLPSTLDHPALENCRELMANHINLPIVTDVLDKLDHVREDVRSQIAYYRTRVKVIPKTPSERLDMILEIATLLEERLASVPMVASLWTKPQERAPSSSRDILRWRRVRAVLERAVSTGEVRTRILESTTYPDPAKGDEKK